MKFKLIFSFLLCFETAFSQQATTQSASNVDSSDTITKIVRVRYALPQKIADLISGGGGPFVLVRADNILNVVVLKGPPHPVASLEQTIHELDVPTAAMTSHNSKDIELIVSIIGGSDKADLLPGSHTPEAMMPVVKQLQAIFPYKDYQLLSSMLLRSSAGAQAVSRGSLAGFEDHSYPNQYTVSYEEAKVATEEGRPAVHLHNFRFETTVGWTTTQGNSTQRQTMLVLIATDVDLREGQKVVVGKANVGSSDLALFVVLTARLVD